MKTERRRRQQQRSNSVAIQFAPAKRNKARVRGDITAEAVAPEGALKKPATTANKRHDSASAAITTISELNMGAQPLHGATLRLHHTAKYAKRKQRSLTAQQTTTLKRQLAAVSGITSRKRLNTGQIN
jgi:hypothetical protein